MRNRRSRIFEILFKLDIGRKLAGFFVSSLGFLSIGVTDASLNDFEKKRNLVKMKGLQVWQLFEQKLPV